MNIFFYVFMGFLTEREREILIYLAEGNSVTEISKKLGISLSSTSRSISRIRGKCLEMEDDINFLKEIGFLKVDGDAFKFISRDPKDLKKKT